MSDQSEQPKRKRGRPKGSKPPKKLRPIKFDPEFEERLKNAAYWVRTSVNAIVEEGARLVLERLERDHNSGQPFPPKPGQQGATSSGGSGEQPLGKDEPSPPERKRKAPARKGKPGAP
jgi:hypothetical protein